MKFARIFPLPWQLYLNKSCLLFSNVLYSALTSSFHTFVLQNYPLFIKTTPTDNELQFYYTVHTSLDVVEEKISSVGKNVNDLRELYLGLLYPTEDYKVYPFERCCC